MTTAATKAHDKEAAEAKAQEKADAKAAAHQAVVGVRTKCTVVAVTRNPSGSARVHLQPVWEEDMGVVQMANKTGHTSALTLEVSNSEAVGFFEVGKPCFVTFSK